MLKGEEYKAMFHYARHQKVKHIKIILLLLILSIYCLFMSCKGKERKKASKDPVVAVIAQSEGALTLKREKSDWLLSTCAGIPIFKGDTIRCGQGESASLVFADSSRLDILENSDAEILSDRGIPVKIFLTRGSFSLASFSRFEIFTPSGNVSCSKAKVSFELKNGGLLSISVFEGNITVSNKFGSIMLSKLEGARVSPSEAPCEADKFAVQARSFSQGCGYFVKLLLKPYFSNEATRDDAEDDARDQILANPVDPWGYVNLGRALLDAGNIEEARTQFTKALEIDNQFPQALLSMGKLLLYEEKWDDASEYYMRARSVEKDMVEPSFGLGMAALGKGDFEKAKTYFKDALEIERDDYMTWTAILSNGM